ncbi:MAG TPA: zinc-dependent alcohol dehydrogenase family protein [Casimicrobiaceae bacterium]
MRAMVLRAPRSALTLATRPEPAAGPGEVLVRVDACGVCRTDLHVVDGELARPRLPLVPGHEVVGSVQAIGMGVEGFAVGDRVGVPWLAWTCGVCRYCASGRENLCARAEFTGYTRDGGYADCLVADSRYAFPLPREHDAAELAPWLCAGLIGYRALRAAGDAQRIGLYGFGAAAHIVAQLCMHQGRAVFAFTRPGDAMAQSFARALGCAWAGASDEPAPEELDAALLFAPVGALVPVALRALAPGGVVVCAGIHMSDIPQFPYEWLWRERRIVSVANLTRADGREFIAEAQRARIRTRVTTYPLTAANDALAALRQGQVTGAAVLIARDDGVTR